MERLSKRQILDRRKEIESELEALLEEKESEFSLEDIKEIIYNEEDSDDLMKIVSMFDDGQGLGEMDNVLELVNDAWNYFPHKVLKGLSPTEKILESQSNN